MRTRRPTLTARVRPRRRRLMPAAALPAAPPGLAAGPPAAGPGMPPGGMPMMKKGGRVKKTGPHMLHKGEKVVPAHKAKDMGAAMKRGHFPPRKKK